MEHNQNIYQEKLKLSVGSTRGLFLAALVTIVIFLVELIGGFISGSLSLLADAGHMASDVFALSISFLAVWFSSKPATRNKTYGFYRVEILAALLNGILLCLIAFFICFEAIERFHSPNHILAPEMLLFATIGLVANIASALLLYKSKESSVNVKAAYLHVITDLLGSVGVIIAAGLIMLTGMQEIDALISILISMLIVRSGWKVITESVDVLLESVPRDLDISQIEEELRKHPFVLDLHDLHIWAITSGVNALSCHIVVNEYDCSKELILSVNQQLKKKFNIDHVTIQLEDRQVEQAIDHQTIGMNEHAHHLDKSSEQRHYHQH